MNLTIFPGKWEELETFVVNNDRIRPQNSLVPKAFGPNLPRTLDRIPSNSQASSLTFEVVLWIEN